MVLAAGDGWKKCLIVTVIFLHTCQAEIIGFYRMRAQHNTIERVANRRNRIRIKIVYLHFSFLQTEDPKLMMQKCHLKTQALNPHMKHSFRQDLPAKLKADFPQDYQDIFCLVSLYPVHPVDAVRKVKLYFVKFLFRLNWPLLRLAVGLDP